MQDQLVEKLNRLLTDRRTFSEAEVVYFLVESRKLLDRQREDGNNVFPLLRFYADWSVHTAKEYRLESIQAIVEKLASMEVNRFSNATYIPDRLKPQVDFIYMTALRDEVNNCLRYFGITDPFDDEPVWISFVISLTAILQEQPIVRPHSAVEEIRYEESAPGSSVLVVVFSDDRGAVRVGNVF
jgi:hypothetical protein